MTTDINLLLQQLTEQLAPLPVDPLEKLPVITANIGLITATLAQIKDEITRTRFADPEQEIAFFKFIKPSVLRHLIYFQHLLVLETSRPTDRDGQRSYLQQQLAAQDAVRLQDTFFYQYYYSAATHLDGHFFRRGHIPLNFPVLRYDPDVTFTTGYDHLIADMQAAMMLSDYLRAELSALSGESTTGQRIDLTWTAPKRGLIELIYALHEAGAFNGGAITLQKLITSIETLFNVSLGNASRTFQEILARKAGDTTFIEFLKAKLVQRIAKIDERTRR